MQSESDAEDNSKKQDNEKRKQPAIIKKETNKHSGIVKRGK